MGYRNLGPNWTFCIERKNHSLPVDTETDDVSETIDFMISSSHVVYTA